jgi:hypothetical protein
MAGEQGAINEDANRLNVGGPDTMAAARIKRYGRVGEAR